MLMQCVYNFRCCVFYTIYFVYKNKYCVF